MIIAKELIDASVKSKQATKVAEDKAMLDAITANVPEVQKRTEDIKELVDTFYYVRKQDEHWGKLLWNAICHEDEVFHLNFCNAILPESGESLGVRVRYDLKNIYVTNIYVTTKRVLIVNYDGRGVKDYCELKDLESFIKPEEYEKVLNTLILLIEAIPAYKDRIAKVLNDIIRG